ncbi:hypothetical protein Tco_0580697 [Tanacetum coccineum]
MNSLPEKWLSFSQGLRNANHIQTLDLADIYRRFVYEDNLILRRYPESKKATITAPSTTPISTAFFSNNIDQDFQENYDDEIDERTSEDYLRDLDIEFYEIALLAGHFIKRRNKFSSPKANENTKCFNVSVSGPVIVCNTEPVTSSVPIEVKNNEQEAKINELTKLVQMPMDEIVNSS